MVDPRFRAWVRTVLGQEGNGLSSYVSNARQLEKRFGIGAMTLPELEALDAEIDATRGRSGRDFVLRRDGKRPSLNPNARMMLDYYIRYRRETRTRPQRTPSASSSSGSRRSCSTSSTTRWPAAS